MDLEIKLEFTPMKANRMLARYANLTQRLTVVFVAVLGTLMVWPGAFHLPTSRLPRWNEREIHPPQELPESTVASGVNKQSSTVQTRLVVYVQEPARLDESDSPRARYSVPNRSGNFSGSGRARNPFVASSEPRSNALDSGMTQFRRPSIVETAEPAMTEARRAEIRPAQYQVVEPLKLDGYPPELHEGLDLQYSGQVTTAPATLQQRWITGVGADRVNPRREPRWRDATPVPWESLSYGEYIGPPRTPHLPEYRFLIGDQVDFVFRRKRELSSEAYRFGIGDSMALSSETQEGFNDSEQTIQLDGTIQVRGIGSVMAANKTISELQAEINRLALLIGQSNQDPKVLIKPINTETRLQDLIRTVDATAGLGGLSRSVTVAPDGTVQLPGIGPVPALGLTFNELSAEANARYEEEVQGLEVTAILNARAPRFVYVLGEVTDPGLVTLNGPTTVMQALAQVRGWRSGANLRHIVVMRRDKNWQLIATKLDLSGALWGHRPQPSDDLWLRHSDIILVPKNPGQRIADFIEVYLTRGLYGIFPTQGFNVSFDGVSSL